MQMTDREYYFDERAELIAKSSGIAELAQQIDQEKATTVYGEPATNTYAHVRSYVTEDDEVDYEIRDFIHSTEFRLLTQIEQAASVRAYQLDSNYNWMINASPEAPVKDRLFPVQEFAGKIACIPSDSLTLSGAGARPFIDVDPTFFEDYAAHGFRNKLDFMQFAGAWLCNVAGSMSRGGAQITLPDSDNVGLLRQVGMGGDMHGDFRMHERLLPAYGATTPFGSQVDFGPLEIKAHAAGYHSIEKSVVNAISAYLIDSDDLSPAEKQRLFEILLSAESPKTIGERGASFYGDFGDDYMNSDEVAMEIDGMRLRASEGRSYTKFMVHPGNERLLLVVSKNDAGELELKNTDQKTGLRFKPHELPDLFKLFMNIGSAEARTSIASIQHAIACAQQTFESGAEAGHIILAD